MKIELKRWGQVLMVSAALTMVMGSCSTDDERDSGTTNPEVTYQGNVAYSKGILISHYSVQWNGSGQWYTEFPLHRRCHTGKRHLYAERLDICRCRSKTAHSCRHNYQRRQADNGGTYCGTGRICGNERNKRRTDCDDFSTACRTALPGRLGWTHHLREGS